MPTPSVYIALKQAYLDCLRTSGEGDGDGAVRLNRTRCGKVKCSGALDKPQFGLQAVRQHS